MSILYLIASGNYISVNKDLIKMFGIETALLLGELASEYEYYSRSGQLIDGCFYSTVKNIKENTGLSEHQQRKAFSLLQEKNILSIKKKGLPAKRYVYIDEQVFTELYYKWCKNLSTGGKKNEALEIEKLRTNKNTTKKELIKNNKEKHIYGEFQNVYLTDEEYQKVVDKDLLNVLEDLSRGIDSKGYKYKNHYSTILNWSKRNEKEKVKQNKLKSKPSFDIDEIAKKAKLNEDYDI